ncbi:hypothetical protein BV898_03549 [Hypsibius exemplaris]|uniref:Uncharacterized protein n=1 Tax=Hypsibius exemplaris TaxID=2072580 RepID=A0A1W0X504_HYPEX|nr:hypothetical protein BV898_03549 [Hypsibius exemplaris]
MCKERPHRVSGHNPRWIGQTGARTRYPSACRERSDSNRTSAGLRDCKVGEALCAFSSASPCEDHPQAVRGRSLKHLLPPPVASSFSEPERIITLHYRRRCDCCGSCDPSRRHHHLEETIPLPPSPSVFSCVFEGHEIK